MLVQLKLIKASRLETENCGYFYAKAEICEKMEFSADLLKGKGGKSDASSIKFISVIILSCMQLIGKQKMGSLLANHSDITVKILSTIFLLKSEHLAEVCGKTSGASMGYGGWMDGGVASETGGWNTGGPSTESSKAFGIIIDCKKNDALRL
ncbi:hypothetical protein OSB04_007795 [Centaurea solstitialis]|uniref:Uncharacterized protein n=1 Tax=Centaurea solstitialis TaxID=347529 RepID=A0AA38TKJ2_9ASTR|nr:hypothetical protein OSB04_007795 [Centaurea solstitialis]